MSDTACLNLRWSLALMDGLVEGGLRHLVISPGSRSTPLVLAGQRCDGLELTPILDERSAAFFALGLARASGHPVALVCTSGSAPAHWFPAVIEAAEWGVPLVLLSADRPPELRTWGANQTTDQTRLFGTLVREFHDPGPPADVPQALKAIRALGRRAAAVSTGRRRGPVHLNLAFREPLVPQGPCVTEPGRGHAQPAEPAARTGLSWEGGHSVERRTGQGLICCGPGEFGAGFAPALWRCAERHLLPVLVDPLSGLRFGPGPRHRIARYDSILRNAGQAEALRPDWVLRFGRAPVSSRLVDWLEGIPCTIVDPAERWVDPTHDAEVQVAAAPEDYCRWLSAAGSGVGDAAFLELWVAGETALDEFSSEFAARAPWCEAQLVSMLLDAMAPGDTLFCGNSLPIRQLDTWSGTNVKQLQVVGNRGASGIDGQLSTLAGLNASGRPTWGILGDLALFHDLSGLLLAERFRRPVLVINNGGGRIFDYLPQAGLRDFERLWRTPVGIGVGALSRCFGIAAARADTAEALRQVLAEFANQPRGGLIEVQIDAECSRRVHQDFWERVEQAPLIQT